MKNNNKEEEKKEEMTRRNAYEGENKYESAK
jgi:hypothetical protein